LGLLRSFLAELTGCDRGSTIVMHIYRNVSRCVIEYAFYWFLNSVRQISEIWQMMKSIKTQAIANEWSLLKLYTFAKSFSLILSIAAHNTNNTALKQAGYRGFELPPPETELAISEWFKALRNQLNEKH
ncbi:hypothetical protein KR222_001538, partial [Zaprionus bogoriensis]